MGFYPKAITYKDARQALTRAEGDIIARGWSLIAFMDCMFDRDAKIGDSKIVTSGRYHPGMTEEEATFAEIINTALTPLEAIVSVLDKTPAEKRPELLAKVRESIASINEHTPNHKQKILVRTRLMDNFLRNYGGKALLEEVERQQANFAEMAI